MKIQLLSDVHTEFHHDGGASFADSTYTDEADALILAGDIGDYHTIREALLLFAETWAPKPIIYIVGNHEFYGGTFEKTFQEINSACSEASNILWLNHDYDWLMPDRPNAESVRFVGTPLWFRAHPDIPMMKNQIGDYQHTKDNGVWINDENTKALAFLERTLRKDDVLITHHLPSSVCVSDEYRGSPLNIFFVCEIGELIAERQPKLAVFGHTHSSVDTMIGNTRVVNNPFGYVGVELNPNFKDHFLIEV